MHAGNPEDDTILNHDYEVLGIIPARGGSKSIPCKNLALLGDKPLIAYTFEAARTCRSLGRIVVSTDDIEISEYSKSQGIEVPFLRPQELATDQAPILPTIRHLLEELESRDGYQPDAVALLQPTSPFRKAEHIDAAIALLRSSDSDSVVSVVEVPHQFSPVSVMRMDKHGRLSPFLEGEGDRVLRRQDKPRLYARNGPAILCSKRETILKQNSLYGKMCTALSMAQEDSIDIDAQPDLKWAEILLKLRSGTDAVGNGTQC